jgi:AraC family transcriptional regulator, regulatory protein of adaptative response / methylated-DNA-[protein]-cysteine methyltransferase
MLLHDKATMARCTAASDSLDLSFHNDDERWQAVLDRNTVASGQFLYGVMSTKVFCQPTCPARRPKRSNVVFLTDAVAARQAGFRPCRRCNPESKNTPSSNTTIIAEACRTIERDQKVSLDELAQQSKLSKFHFQRTFKKVIGMTPQQYKAAQRSKPAKDPARIVFSVGPCYLGHILVAVSERGICAVELGDDLTILVEHIQFRFPNAEFRANHPEFDALISILGGAAESPRIAEWELPLDIQGTAFQHRVWNYLREIPWGVTRTYSEIANLIGSPEAARAVAKACAANPIAIAIPCHRIVRASEAESGYRWGRERKKLLLEMEGGNSVYSGDTLQEFKTWLQECI